MIYPETPGKPFQDAVQMIREGIVNTLSDGTQGPLLIAALREALGLPSNLVNVAGAAVSLNATHIGAIVELLAEDTIVTLPAQATFAWPATVVMITIRSEHPFQLTAESGVVVNGETAETWACEAWPRAITLHRRGADSWGLTGAAAVAP